ncbi:hypothetical protein HGRIS_012004 [Hohenbuehelia grisea]|uniref:Uncharacterized protein n=1 Tax=Hohenbuehelia grisea TaxID=104357 RepID=A0ABR3IP36_9AGAR
MGAKREIITITHPVAQGPQIPLVTSTVFATSPSGYKPPSQWYGRSRDYDIRQALFRRWRRQIGGLRISEVRRRVTHPPTDGRLFYGYRIPATDGHHRPPTQSASRRYSSTVDLAARRR